MKNYLEGFNGSPDEEKETAVRADGGTGQWDYYERTREMEANERMNKMRAEVFRSPGIILSRPCDVIEKSETVYPVPRNDGKRVCRKLRQARVDIARANHIPFISVPCRQEVACGGSCPTCDAEVEYLERELAKIPEHMRIYPKLNFGEEDE